MSNPQAMFQQAQALHREGELDRAIELYRKCTSATPRVGAPWYYLGLALHARLRLPASAEALAKASSLLPGDLSVRGTYATVEVMLGRFDRAIRAWRDLVASVPSSIEARLGLAQCLFELRRPEEAMQVLDEALARPGWDADGRLLRARLRFAERLGHTQVASRDAATLLAQHPGDPEAALYASRLPLPPGAPDEASERRRLLDLAVGGDPRSYITGLAHLDLGKLLEKERNYDGAFAAVTRGKQLLFDIETPENRAHELYMTHVRSFEQRVSPDWGAAWDAEPAASSRKTGIAEPAPAFIVGFPRTGTTLLEQILNAHPALHATDELPVLQPVRDVLQEHFVGREAYPTWLGKLTPRQLEQGREAYWNRARWYCGEALNGKKLVDKQPLNLSHLPLAKRLFPKAPVIVVIRDPRDTCLSCFFQPMRGVPAFYNLDHTAELYVALMDLWAYYKRVLNLNFMELRYEDLVADPEAKAREVLAFLGVDWNPEVLKFYEPKHRRMITTPSYQDVTRPVYSSAKARWRNYERHMTGALKTLAGKVEQLGYEPWNPTG